MRQFVFVAAGFVMVCCMVIPASGAITFTEVSGDGSIGVAYEGILAFPDLGSFTAPGTIIEKGIESLDPFVVTVAYDASDFDSSGAFRWTERITNNSSSTWYDFHIDLDLDGEFWFGTASSGDQWPGMASIGPWVGATAPVSIDMLAALGSPDLNGNVMTLSADKLHIDILFGTPINPNESFDVFTPIRTLTTNQANEGSFMLTETPTVPEPTTFIIWSVLGVLGLAVGFRRR